MNFIRHQNDIKKLLTTQGGRQYSGCYIYSRDQHDKTHKIGMSQAGLFRRIKQAGSCYPFKTEFWLEYVIISLDGHYTIDNNPHRECSTQREQTYEHCKDSREHRERTRQQAKRV